MGNSPHIASIHILDDDSLLNIFLLYRPFFLGEGENDYQRLYGGDEPWGQGRWWYTLAHVCQRWRNLTLGAASYLRLSLVCTNGIPVANMLAHSPPLPLTVDYSGEAGITAEDEQGISLALERRDRVRHLRLLFPVQDMQKLVMKIDGEFPTLEFLILEPQVLYSTTTLMLPKTLQTQNLRHLMLRGFTCPILRPRLNPTAVGLVTLYLTIDHPSAYFEPNDLLQRISFMPQLERLVILFSFPVPNLDVERQFTHAPITTHFTLPYLRWFWFRGVSAYLEAVVRWVTTPRLEKLHIQVPEELTFSVPHLVQFINATQSLRFDGAEIQFSNKRACVETYARETDAYAFTIKMYCEHLDWQVSSAAQISNALRQVFSAVEHLTLKYQIHSESSEEHNDVDRIEWRNLLRPFRKVRILRIEGGPGLIEKFSRCLRLENGEDPLELLPELQELTYSGTRYAGDTFTSFIDARENAGHPVALVRRNRSPSPS